MELAIKLFKGQGLGNQIFCITSLYKLSLLLKRKPVIFNYSNYKGEEFLPLNNSIFRFYENNLEHEFEIINDSVEEEIFSGLDKTDHKNFIYELFKSKRPRLLLNGNLQNEFFIPSKEELFKIFPSLLALNNPKEYKENKEILIHIRGGDYKKTLAKATKGFYKNSIKFLESNLHYNFKKFIVCDDHIYAKSLLKEIPIISSSQKDKSDKRKAKHHLGYSIKKDFEYLIKAKYAIIPASTFSFWARIFAHAISKDVITIAPLNWYGFRLGNKFFSPLRYTYKEFKYIDKNGNIHNYENIIENYKNYFCLKNIKLHSKIRTTLNIFIINLFK